MAEVTIAILSVAVVALLVFALRRPGRPQDEEVKALRNDLSILRETTKRSIDGMQAIFGQQLSSMDSNVQTSLARVVADVSKHLDAINQNVADRLNENVTAMANTSGVVNDRVATVQTAFAGLQKQIGEMSEQARQLAEMSRAMAGLERILTSPKLRGGFGEAQLESLLSNVFARDQFQTQYAFPSGEKADAVLLFPQGLVVIDSKFPLESFKQISAAETEPERKAARREFLRDVRGHIATIAEKYIRPADGTLPFALAYIPAENVYYEAIIRDEEGNDLHPYCIERRVYPVSPNSLYVYLHTIVTGLNGMRISQRAEAILRGIDSLRIDLDKFKEVYGKVGTHLKNAGRGYEDSLRAMDRVESRVQSLAGDGAGKATLDEGVRPKELEPGDA
ncbi:MAG: DNA recombination protein RmuC [Terriglobales bacterium]